MSELNEIWADEIIFAEAWAREIGRNNLTDYITLRASNDNVRAKASEWLLQSFLEIARESKRSNLKIETKEAHRFDVGNATMVGAKLNFALGVRQLTIEVGWTQQPNDGFMRGGSLAYARILHFGIIKENEELMLIRNAQDSPQWFTLKNQHLKLPFGFANIGRHFAIFLEN